MAELQSRNHCWGNKTMSKGSSGPKHTETKQQSSGIKSFGLMNQSLKSLGQIGGSICSEELVKKLQPLVSQGVAVVQHREESVIAWQIFANCKVGD